MRYMRWMIDNGSYEPGPEEIDADPEFIAGEQMMAERGIEHRGERLSPPGHAVTVRRSRARPDHRRDHGP